MPVHSGKSLGRVARKPLSSGTSDAVYRTNMVQTSENMRRALTGPTGHTGHFGSKQCHDLEVSARGHHVPTTGTLTKPLTDNVDGHLTTMSTERGGQELIGSRLAAIGENSADRQVYGGITLSQTNTSGADGMNSNHVHSAPPEPGRPNPI